MGGGRSVGVWLTAAVTMLSLGLFVRAAKAQAGDPAETDPKSVQVPSVPTRNPTRSQASCGAQAADLATRTDDVELGFDSATQIRSGGGLKFHWKVPHRLPTGRAVYVVLSISGEARIEAEATPPLPPPADKTMPTEQPDAAADDGSPKLPGFIVLPPPSAGLRKIVFGAGTTRVFVALDRVDAHLSGSLTVRLYDSGVHALKSAIVAVASCGETELKVTPQQAVSVVPAAAEIVVEDPYDAAVPKTAILSNGGRYLLQAFDGYYRVFDVATGAKLIDRAGHDPNFSPTGKFVAANTGAGDDYEIIDLLSRTPVAVVTGPFVGWSEEDAYVIGAASGSWASLSIRPTLISMPVTANDSEPSENVDGLSISEQSPEKNTPAWEAFGLKIDADAGLVGFSRLSADTNASKKATVFDIATGQEMAERSSAMFTKGLLARSPIHFSHIFSVSSEKTYNPEWAEERAKSKVVKELSKFQVTHKHLDRVAVMNFRKSSVPSVDWRASRSIGTSLDSDKNFNSLTREFARFGIALAAEVPRDEFPAPFSALRATVGIDEATSQSPQSLSQIETYKARLIQEVPAAQQILKDGMLSDQSIDLSRQLEGLWRWEVNGEPLWLLEGVEGQGSGGFAEINSWILRGQPPAGKVQSVLGDIPENYNPHVTDVDDNAVKPKARIFLDRYLVMGMAGPKIISVIDLKGEQPNVLIRNIPQAELLADVRLSDDAKHVIQVNSDGQFFFHDIARNKMVLAGRFVDGEILFYTPEGYYWSSYEGAHFVQLRFPGLSELASFRQFASVLNRPDFVKAQLKDEFVALPPPHLTPPPSLQLQLADGLLYQGARPELSVRIRATSSIGLERVRFYYDGQLVKDQALTGADVDEVMRLPLSRHARWLTALATDRNGVVSAPHAFRLTPSGHGTNTLYAVVAGVDKYSSPRLNLKYARSDAGRLAAALKSRQAIYYAAQNVDLLVDETATTQKILTSLRSAVARAGPQDTLLFFFAGHGVQGKDGHYYLAPSDLKLDDVAHTGLPWSEVASVLGKAQARVVVVLDACHAGLSGSEGLATNDDAVSGLLSGSHAPVLVLAASKGRESSFEGSAWQGGVFTYALTKILSDEPSGQAARQAIDISDLYRKLREIVAKETGGRQTPWLARQDLIGDFAIF